ncbi:hypothetical protein [Coxiella endosymbiont of Rhipicephalus microplus]|nr:hypothetical protein [Coxiella endosymbiont of Rhipicephalus microplus]
MTQKITFYIGDEARYTQAKRKTIFSIAVMLRFNNKSILLIENQYF